MLARGCIIKLIMSKLSTRKPIFHSDFDGTAVEVLPWTNPRNWSKYPLKGVPGYLDFILGVEDSGVEVGSIVSRRPDIAPRRWATDASLRDVASRQFERPGQVLLMGSEEKKAGRIASEAHKRVVGFIDDKPHKAGIEIARSLDKFDVMPRRVVMGAVQHAKSWNNMEQLRTFAGNDGFEIQELTISGGFSITNGNFVLEAIQLPGYSRDAGQTFGSRLNMLDQQGI